MEENELWRPLSLSHSTFLLIKDGKNVYQCCRWHKTGMSANMLDDTISTQKDLSKLERQTAMNKIFKKNSKGLYSDFKKSITPGMILIRDWPTTAWEPSLPWYLVLYGPWTKNAIYILKYFSKSKYFVSHENYMKYEMHTIQCPQIVLLEMATYFCAIVTEQNSCDKP